MSPCREPVLIDRPPALKPTPGLTYSRYDPRTRCPCPTGMASFYDMSDPQPSPSQQTVNVRQAKVHPWSRPSPWLYGLVILLAIAGIVATQAPRVSMTAPARGRGPSPAPTAALPSMSGTAYTQAMVAGRNFIGADLRGARLIRLDLRGKNFQGADAAGAVFAGSFLNGAIFSNADLRGADFRDACLRGADLINAQLSGADFTDADVAGATIAPAAKAETIGWTSNSASPVCPRD